MKKIKPTKQTICNNNKHWFRNLSYYCFPFPTLCLILLTSATEAIMAGGKFDLPEDSPSSRLDSFGVDSPYNFVGALEILSADRGYKGSASVLSPHWALTAGHNVDFNDDGQADDVLTVILHLPGFGTYTASDIIMQPEFTGFANPTIHHDLALLYFDVPLPADIHHPVLGLAPEIGDIVTLAGYGRSGYGSYGYTTNASLTDRRIGRNTIARFDFEPGGVGQLFRYDFDPPDSSLSLGNDIETIIGPGDSGGPVLIEYSDLFGLAGISTFTEGYGGRFGDIGGGVVLDPYWEWIAGTTGLTVIPEPSSLLILCLLVSHFAGNRFFCFPRLDRELLKRRY